MNLQFTAATISTYSQHLISILRNLTLLYQKYTIKYSITVAACTESGIWTSLSGIGDVPRAPTASEIHQRNLVSTVNTVCYQRVL